MIASAPSANHSAIGQPASAAAADAAPSMLSAIARSRPVRPPASCVESATRTLRQRMSRSGWWFGGFGKEADPDDERDRVGERRALELLADLVAAAIPSGVGGEPLCDRFVVESLRHEAIVRVGPEPLQRGRPSWARLRAMTMDLPTSESPTAVELDREHGLTVTWVDGSKASFALEELRVNCPCAECRGLREQHRPVWPQARLAATPRRRRRGARRRVGRHDHVERRPLDRHLLLGPAAQLGRRLARRRRRVSPVI